MDNASEARSGSWLSVIALALAAPIFNAMEFVPAGPPSDISRSLEMPISQVGLVLTTYVWVALLASLPMILLTRSIERRKLLVEVFLLFIVSHVLSGLAWGFQMLMLDRIGIAFAYAVFRAIAASLVVRMAPPEQQAKALGLLAIGTTLVIVLGIPLGWMVGKALGWHTTFMTIARLSVPTLFYLVCSLPPLSSQNSGFLHSLSMLFRRSAPVCLYVLTVMVISAQLIAYSYIGPSAKQVAQISGETTILLLLLSDGTGIFDSILPSHYSEALPRGFLLAAILVLGNSLALLLPLSTQPTWLTALNLPWGVSIMRFGLAQQPRVLRLVSDATGVAMALFSDLYSTGIGTGALLGSVVSGRVGLASIGNVGAALVLANLLLALFVALCYAETLKSMSL